ncbi:MAG: 5-dehydro-2-deoxygluconokinase [Intrasporangium sp.]|uniref:5-dehydro-2-deoxygluconokinase n=1 Tax=Intrasporangium sp. TaxID=1925024 RepID=UPI00264703B2|nr:5-dehydro-2-deoxygluconokinase [Intrasporangium sp.]MDN5795834.1 5-dehydro-2-deoxygluconokinase [Intrasporangium sp.]
MTAYDLITLGRVGVDLYPQQHDVPLEVVKTFERFLGGSAANVCVATARYGRRVALISRVGDDAFGRFVRSELLRLDVDTEFITTVDDPTPTPLTFCEIYRPDHFPLVFYRYPTAPDLLIDPAMLPLDAIREARVFWATGTGLSQEPSRAAHHAAWEARGRTEWTILDLDYRQPFWSSPEAAAGQLRRALPKVTAVVGTADECTMVTGEADSGAAAEALLAQGLDLVVVKRGRLGALAVSPDAQLEVPAYPAEVVSGLGSADAFGGALVHGLLDNWDLRRMLNFASIAGAIVASRMEASTAMPSAHEVDRLLDDVSLQDEFS